MTACERMIAKWSSPYAKPLIRGQLIDEYGCVCAQGDVLVTCGGFTPDELRGMWVHVADRETAKVLGISIAHAVLLSLVNDRKCGFPKDVLDVSGGGIERILGPNAKAVLAFWKYLDRMTKIEWAAAGFAALHTDWSAGWDAAVDTAKTAALDTAKTAALDAGIAAAGVAGVAASYATWEIQGFDELKSKPVFLPIFGIDVRRG